MNKTTLAVLTIGMIAAGLLLAHHVSSAHKNLNPGGQPSNHERAAGDQRIGDEVQDAEVYSLFSLMYPEVVDAATQLKNDVPAILHFVSDAVRNEPYDGILRGSRGTLLAGAGNSADKAILLRDILHVIAPQFQTRFATCTLTPEQAVQLIVSSQSQDGITSRIQTHNSMMRRVHATKVAPTKSDKAAVDTMISYWGGIGQTVGQNAIEMQAKLSQQVINVPNALLARSQLLETVRTHFWLQYRQGSDWLDLDSTIPGSAIGQQRCTADNVLPELPEELYHHVKINVLLEERRNGQIATSTLLRTTWRTSQLTGSTITYAQAEPLNVTLTASQPTTTNMSRYTPILLVNDEYTLGTPFYLPAPISSANKPMGQIVGGQIGGILGSHQIGNIGAAPNKNVNETKPEVIGLWLQFVVAPPHGPPDIIERPIIDRIGYAARAANQRETAAAAPLRVVGSEYDSVMGVWSIAIWTGEKSLPSSLDPKLREQTTRAPSGNLHTELENLGLVHRAYYQFRTSLFQMATKTSNLPFLYAGPDLSLLHWTPEPGLAGNRFAIDLLSRNIMPFPDGNSATNPFIWAEVGLESEGLLLADWPIRTKEFDHTARERSVDVAEIFARAKQNNIPIELLGPNDERDVNLITPSDDARARIRHRLKEGRLLLIPAHAVDISAQPVVGWWAIDPRDGFVIDEMENGSHQAVEGPLVNKEESEKNTEAAGEYLRKFKKGVCLLIRTVGFIMAVHTAAVDMKAGNVEKLPDDIQDAIDNVDGAEKDCEGDESSPVGPVGENDPGNPLPRISNAPRNSVPSIRIPPFNGLPRGR